MFGSIEEVERKFGEQGYIADRTLATTIYLAAALKKPIFLEGEPGVGKTEVAKVMAEILGTELIRLQCYEGLDANTALYEWNYPRQMLELRLEEARGLAKDDIGRNIFGEAFLLKRPLLRAIQASDGDQPVLLIDEVDRSDEEFEAFLLEILSDFQVTIPEIGTIKAHTQPLVFLTSNDAREMSDALKRRCLHLWIDYPSEELEVRILDRKVPNIDKRLAEEVVQLMNRIRELDLKKTPSISETLDWARALLALNADELEDQIVSDTLNVILKYEGDVQKAQNELSKLIQKRTAEEQAAKPQAAPAQASAKKGILH
jgi:MoxR-like ATPase